VALFKKFQALYGLRWDEQFRTTAVHDLAIDEWGLGLYGLTGEQIATGIDRCRTESEWPPSIAKFVRLAKSWEHNGPAYKPTEKQAKKPRSQRDKDVARAALAEIKKILRR
jgi:hypothetical protein